MQHFNIDMEKTGARLKYLITSAGYSVKNIQEYLQLSCPQPVYRWFKGKVMPSLEHLYALSVLLGVHMEDLIIMECKEVSYELCRGDEYNRMKRMGVYYRHIYRVA